MPRQAAVSSARHGKPQRAFSPLWHQNLEQSLALSVETDAAASSRMLRGFALKPWVQGFRQPDPRRSRIEQAGCPATALSSGGPGAEQQLVRTQSIATQSTATPRCKISLDVDNWETRRAL